MSTFLPSYFGVYTLSIYCMSVILHYYLKSWSRLIGLQWALKVLPEHIRPWVEVWVTIVSTSGVDRSGLLLLAWTCLDPCGLPQQPCRRRPTDSRKREGGGSQTGGALAHRADSLSAFVTCGQLLLFFDSMFAICFCTWDRTRISGVM